MTVETDAHGRLYLSAELREQYGEKFHVLTYEDRIELVPIDDDPLAAVREEIGDAIAGKSTAELRAEALDRARQEAKADLEHPGNGEDDE